MIKKEQTFEQSVESFKGGGLTRDFIYFLKQNKKWWLLPFIFIFVGMGMLVMLSGTGVAPFVYTLF